MHGKDNKLITGISLHVKLTQFPAFNIIIRKIASNIIISACGITKGMYYKNV